MSASESPMPYVSAAHIEANPPDWYATSMPVNNAPYDAHFGFVNPYVTPSVSSAGFSPIPEHSKSTGAPTPMINYATTVAGDSLSYPSVSGFSLDYSRPPTDVPRLSIPSHLEYPQHYNNYLRGSDNTYFYGFTAPFDSLPPRPRSSPSVFSPVTPGGSRAADHFAWPPSTNALGISHSGIDEAMLTTNSHHHPVLASSPPQSSSAPTPEMIAPQPRRMYPPIAPHPLSLQRLAATAKRGHDDDSEVTEYSIKRRKSTASSSGHGAGLQAQELSEEDKLLLKLKDEESLPWKDIAARFQTDLGKSYQIPALQMRLKRLRERLRVWTDADVKALRLAHEYWRENKFEIIAAKMIEFGASERWSTKQCARKWAEIDPSATPFMTAQEEHQQAGFSYTASPEGSSSYMPYMHMP